MRDDIVEELEGHDHKAHIRCQEYKLVWPMANRQSLTARGGKKLDEESGTWVQWETSVKHNSVPEKSSPVRTRVNLVCFFFEPEALDTDAQHTKATYIADVEMGGSIPQWLENLASSKACDRLISFRKMAQQKNLKK